MSSEKKFNLMTYNIQDMHDLFDRKKKCMKEDEHSVCRIKNINQLIRNVDPHILGVIEAPSQFWRRKLFRWHPGLQKMGFRDVFSDDHDEELKCIPDLQTKHALAIFYRNPLQVVSVNQSDTFYKPWTEDIDDDSIEELISFERIPLEVRFHNSDTGKEFLVILIALKSKFVNQPTDIIRFHTLALANRKKLLAQAKKIRERLEYFMDREPDLPIVLMGDFNDSPQLDSYEKQLGISALETMMGSVFEPDRIFHNVLSHWRKDPVRSKELYSAIFQDPVVHNHRARKVWIDHILLSPHFLTENSYFSLEKGSGKIINQGEAAKASSDHFPLSCRIACHTDLP